MHVASIGELLIDFTPGGKNELGISMFGCNPGGAPANVLAMNARLGGQTAFIGKVGRDRFGDYLKATLDDAGIDTSGLIQDPAFNTTLAFVHLDAHGDRSFSFYRSPGADLMLTAAEVNRAVIESAWMFHFGSVSLTGEPCRNAVHETLAWARAAGKIISYDPNYRPPLWNSEQEAVREMLRPVSQVDLLKVSDEELRLLTGKSDLEQGAAELASMGPAIVLVSLGADGAFFHCANGSGRLATYDVATVDTNGAGDAFLGAVHSRLNGYSRDALRAIPAQELADIVDFANAAGSLTTTVRGAIPAMPDKTAIERCRREIPLLKK